MDLVSPQDVYARHLVSRRGYPLWTPEPSLTLPDAYRQQGFKIGDVGVVVPEDGSFDVFFNICLPPDHSLHRQTGVPNDFKHVPLEDRDIAIFREVEPAGRIISASSVARIGGQSSDENTRSQPGPLNYEFSLSSKEGALLILPEGAERYYLRNQRQFLEEAIQHAVDWYDFAEQRLGRIISHDALYLITGFYKAQSWSLASYQHASGAGSVHAQFKALQVGRGNISSSYSWETTHALDWRVGPSNEYYNGIANQSVFIQGFKIAVRSSILGAKRVRVKAEPPAVRPPQVTFYTGSRRPNVGPRSLSGWFGASSPNTSGEKDADSDMDIREGSSDSGSILNDFGEDITIQHIPEVSKPFHPSDIINQYLLRSHPSAGIAITHDTQWGMLLEDELIQPEDVAREGRLEELVSNISQVSREGVVYLHNIVFDDAAESNASKENNVNEQEIYPTLFTRDQEELPGYVGSTNMTPDDLGDNGVASGSQSSLPQERRKSSGIFLNTTASELISGQMISGSSQPEHVMSWYRVCWDAVILNGPRQFVPQTIYQPLSQGDRERYVSLVKLHPPIIFLKQDSPEWGIPVRDLLYRHAVRVVDENEPAFASCGPSIGIRVQWPGYQPCHKQVTTRDYTRERRMITKAKLAKVVAKCVKEFMNTLSEKAMELGSNGRWRVGPFDIKVDDIILVSLHQVSQGSWQPQLRCRRTGVGEPLPSRSLPSRW